MATSRKSTSSPADQHFGVYVWRGKELREHTLGLSRHSPYAMYSPRYYWVLLGEEAAQAGLHVLGKHPG